MLHLIVGKSVILWKLLNWPLQSHYTMSYLHWHRLLPFFFNWLCCVHVIWNARDRNNLHIYHVLSLGNRVRHASVKNTTYIHNSSLNADLMWCDRKTPLVLRLKLGDIKSLESQNNGLTSTTKHTGNWKMYRNAHSVYTNTHTGSGEVLSVKKKKNTCEVGLNFVVKWFLF